MTLLSELAAISKLNEAVQPLPQDMDLEQMLTELEKRMGGAKRGLGFANRLRNPIQKKKHMSSVLGNMNQIRAQLNRAIKQMEQFANAANDYESKYGEFNAGDATASQADTQQIAGRPQGTTGAVDQTRA